MISFFKKERDRKRDAEILLFGGTVHGEKEYVDFVVLEGIEGADIQKDNFAIIKNILGGRVRGYENKLARLRDEVIRDFVDEVKKKGANAVENFRVDYNFPPIQKAALLCVSCSGTAIKVKDIEKYKPDHLHPGSKEKGQSISIDPTETESGKRGELEPSRF